MIKSCGGCKYFIKFNGGTVDGFSGICDKVDSRAKSGNVCKHWKGLKYDRNKMKQKFLKLTITE